MRVKVQTQTFGIHEWDIGLYSSIGGELVLYSGADQSPICRYAAGTWLRVFTVESVRPTPEELQRIGSVVRSCGITVNRPLSDLELGRWLSEIVQSVGIGAGNVDNGNVDNGNV